MKVCMVAQKSIGLVAGGPLIQVRETAGHLEELGIEIEWFDMWRHYRAGQFDLAHIFGASMLNHDIALRLNQFGIPYVVSPIFYSMRSPAEIRATLRAEASMKRVISGIRTDFGFTSSVCHGALGILPNTTAEGRLIREGMGIPADRIHIVPNGVDPGFADGDPDLFFRTYGVRDFILNVGHLGSRRKNVLRLIHALRTIDHPAVIIGQIQRGKYADACLEEAGRNPNILIIDGLENDSPLLASAYAAARVFVLPSLYETPGIAALEAGLAGATLVITPHGGTRDYFGDLATYVEPRSVTSIRTGIERALALPRDERLQNRIFDRYTWRTVAERTADIYREVMDSARSGPPLS